jgi:hypothetical protein
MIDRHYGHLACDGRERAIRLLDEQAPDNVHGGRCVDADASDFRQQRQQK